MVRSVVQISQWAMIFPPTNHLFFHSPTKVGRIDIRLDHVPIAKTHLLPAATMRRTFLQILSARTSRYSFETPANIFKIIYFAKWKELYGFFSSRRVAM